MVFIHGGGFGGYYSLYSWSLNLQALSQHFHVIAFDKLGMGFTDNPETDDGYTMDAMIDHAHRFLEKMGVQRAIVVGHSRGGFIAAALAVEHPDMVQHLVVADSNTLAPKDPTAPRGFYDRIDQSLPQIPTRESVCREAMANSYSSRHITEDFVDEMYQIAKLPKTIEAQEVSRRTKKTVFLPLLEKRKEQIHHSISDGRLKQPTLLVWGWNDPSAPYLLAMKLFDLIAPKNPDMRLHIFNSAGHYSYREHPDEFNKLVTSFCSLRSG